MNNFLKSKNNIYIFFKLAFKTKILKRNLWHHLWPSLV